MISRVISGRICIVFFPDLSAGDGDAALAGQLSSMMYAIPTKSSRVSSTNFRSSTDPRSLPQFSAQIMVTT
jgi:hypothetical protein